MYASEHAHVQAVMAEAALPGQPAASTAEEQAGGGEPGGGAEVGDGGRARTGAAAEDAGSGPPGTVAEAPSPTALPTAPPGDGEKTVAWPPWRHRAGAAAGLPAYDAKGDESGTLTLCDLEAVARDVAAAPRAAQGGGQSTDGDAAPPPVYGTCWVHMLPEGLRWKEAGADRPSSGAKIHNEALASALQEKCEFSPSEWCEFEVGDLSFDSYVKVGDGYWKPDERPAGTEINNEALVAALKEAANKIVAGQTVKTLDGGAVHQHQLSKAALWDSYIKVGDEFWRPSWRGCGPDLRGLDLSDTDMTGLDLRGARLQGANLAGTNLAGSDSREASFGNAVLSEGYEDPTVPGLEWEINRNIEYWGPGAGTEIKNEALAAALKEFCEDNKGKGSTKKFTNDEIVGFQVAELRVNSYIKVTIEKGNRTFGKFCQPAAQEIKSAWSKWEKGQSGCKATRVAQMPGALVSGSDFEGASMRGVNMLLVNGRYANLQKTLQHAANFR